jgi:hypothetical protein
MIRGRSKALGDGSKEMTTIYYSTCEVVDWCIHFKAKARYQNGGSTTEVQGCIDINYFAS